MNTQEIAATIRDYVNGDTLKATLAAALDETPIIINWDDIRDAGWDHVYMIRLETGTVWLSEPFIVSASDEQSALDEVADYCAEHAPGYIIIGGDGIADEGEYTPAGNGDTYIRDTGSTRLDVLLTRQGYGSTYK